MPQVNDSTVFYSRNQLSKKVAKLAGNELFGFKTCDVTWGELFAKHLIIDMIECTGAEHLNQAQADCLVGKLSEDLTVNCC